MAGERINTDGNDAPKPRKSQADKLIDIVQESGAILFQDQFSEPYAHVMIKDHWETLKLKSKYFRRWLCASMWQKEGKAPHSNALASALNILESKACFEGPRHELQNRVAWRDGALWCDLSNEKWEAVKITATGWSIEKNPPILFRRYAHQKAQVTPVANGDIFALLPFVNLANSEAGNLLLIYIVTCFIPDIPHPIPILYGPQGASKTTLARALCRLIDPSEVEVLSTPNTPTDLIQQLSHHWFAFYDNVSGLPLWASDALCRSVTGEGFSKRELYSDDEDVIYSFRRCIGLNGINIAAKKPDLLDRSILLKLERISKEKREGEQGLWERFEAVRPAIMGGIFDALSKAIATRPSITLKQVPRMADFTLWGCATAMALGTTAEDFIAVYFKNIGEQHEEAIQENSVGTAMIVLMADRTDWEGSSSSLLRELETIAEEQKIGMRSSDWPKAANSLSRKLNEIKTNLAEVGIHIDHFKGSNGTRTIRIHKEGKNTADTATYPTDLFSLPSPSTSPQENTLEDETSATSGDSGDISDQADYPF